jgi:DSF synthase
MNNVEQLHRDHPFSAIRTQEDHDSGAYWCHMHAQQAYADPEYRACFSPRLLRELRLFAQQTIDGINRSVAESNSHLAHIILASDSHVFNLGGDLQLFTDLIRSGDEQGLLRYAHECVDSIHLLHTRLHPHAHTIALVQGDALGGGLELALACQTIVAERGVQMGFPEVLFGLFPGMGAYSFLSRRISPRLAEQMMLNGVMYSSEELHEMGIVDVLVPKGEGVRAVHEVIRQNRRIANARLAVHKAREIVAPVSLQELNEITEVWVEAALKLSDKQLKVMERLARAQLRRPKTVLEQVTAV